MNVVSAMSFVWDTKPDFPLTGAFNKEVYKVTASEPTKFLPTLIFP